MPDVRVLTAPADPSRRQVIRAGVITHVISGREHVRTTWTGRKGAELPDPKQF